MNIEQEMKDFVSYFVGKSGTLEKEDFEKYNLKATLKHYKKGEYLISQGQAANNIYFLKKGAVRYLSVSPEGKEFTQSFSVAPAIAGSTRSMVKESPALFSIEVLDDVLCYQFNWQDFYQKMHAQTGFLLAYNCLLETLFIKKEEREYAFVQLNAEQRYLNFMENNPTLRDKIPLKVIASHIGITPIALSRIRKKLQ